MLFTPHASPKINKEVPEVSIAGKCLASSNELRQQPSAPCKLFNFAAIDTILAAYLAFAFAFASASASASIAVSVFAVRNQ